jgi:hypothetical protein
MLAAKQVDTEADPLTTFDLLADDDVCQVAMLVSEEQDAVFMIVRDAGQSATSMYCSRGMVEP